MSTNSRIGILHEDGTTETIYCHWDGYPEHQIPYPPAIKKAIEVLQKRAQNIDDDIQEMIDELEDGKK